MGQVLFGVAAPIGANHPSLLAAELLAQWSQSTPTVLVVTETEETLIKSFRNLERVVVTVPSELKVAEIVWARSLLFSEAALPLVQGRAE